MKAADWDNAFVEAVLTNESGLPSLCISNRKPSHETARNVFMEDEPMIMVAAKRNGFKLISAPGSRGMNFVKA